MRLLAYGREIDCGEPSNKSVVVAGDRDHIRYRDAGSRQLVNQTDRAMIVKRVVTMSGAFSAPHASPMTGSWVDQECSATGWSPWPRATDPEPRRRLRELVTSGELGDVQQVDIELSIPGPPDSDPRWSLELGGGATMDLGRAQRSPSVRSLDIEGPGSHPAARTKRLPSQAGWRGIPGPSEHPLSIWRRLTCKGERSSEALERELAVAGRPGFHADGALVADVV
jgi:hypothetical protein